MAEYAWFSLNAVDQITVPFIDRIHPKSNKFATGVENKATGDSKLHDSPS